MADVFEEEVEQTVSIQEYLKDVEDQELVSLCVYWNFRVSCECFFSHPPLFFWSGGREIVVKKGRFGILRHSVPPMTS